jgi:hypothetical protein
MRTTIQNGHLKDNSERADGCLSAWPVNPAMKMIVLFAIFIVVDAEINDYLTEHI